MYACRGRRGRAGRFSVGNGVLKDKTKTNGVLKDKDTFGVLLLLGRRCWIIVAYCYYKRDYNRYRFFIFIFVFLLPYARFCPATKKKSKIECWYVWMEVFWSGVQHWVGHPCCSLLEQVLFHVLRVLFLFVCDDLRLLWK